MSPRSRLVRVLIAAVLLSSPVPAQVNAYEPTAEQLQRAKDEYAKVGAKYVPEINPRTQRSMHGFRPSPKTQDTDLKDLPNPPFPFTLHLNATRVTDKGLKEVKGLTNLICLCLRGNQVTDAGLKTLREIGLLHVLDQAGAKDGKRPMGSGDVVTLNLNDTQ